MAPKRTVVPRDHMRYAREWYKRVRERVEYETCSRPFDDAWWEQHWKELKACMRAPPYLLPSFIDQTTFAMWRVFSENGGPLQAADALMDEEGLKSEREDPEPPPYDPEAGQRQYSREDREDRLRDAQEEADERRRHRGVNNGED